MANERTRTREPEPEQESTYDQGVQQYRNVRQRVNNPYVRKGSETPWEQNRQGKNKFYSHPAVDNAVLPDLKVFKLEIADKSGRHTHQGGYTIYGVSGEGETLVDDERVQWKQGDVVVLPFKPGGLEHQHFNRNDPDNPAVWLATNWNPYLLQTGALFKQEETSQHWRGYGHHEHDHDADLQKVSEWMVDFSYQDWRDYEPPDETATLYDALMVRRNRYRKQMARAQDAGNWALLEGDDLDWEWNPQGKIKWYIHPDLDDRSMKAILFSLQEIPPGSRSGKQFRQGGLAHYIQSGIGHSIIDGDRYDWTADDFVGLPVKPDGVTVQHFNDDPDRPARFVRVEPFIHEAVGYDLGCGFRQLEPCPEFDGR